PHRRGGPAPELRRERGDRPLRQSHRNLRELRADRRVQRGSQLGPRVRSHRRIVGARAHVDQPIRRRSGFTRKKLEIRLAPTFGGSAKTTAYDFGFLVRFSPLELAPSIRDVVGLDLAYGWSELSFESDPVF